MGVELLAITDHDNVEAHKYLNKEDFSNMFSGEIIVDFIHKIGYFIQILLNKYQKMVLYE